MDEQNKSYAFLEIAKLLDDPDHTKARVEVYRLYTSLWENKDSIVTVPEASKKDVASVIHDFDIAGGLYAQGLIDEEPFMGIYVDVIINCWTCLERYIKQRQKNSPIYAKYFEELKKKASEYWEKNFSAIPEPKPFNPKAFS